MEVLFIAGCTVDQVQDGVEPVELARESRCDRAGVVVLHQVIAVDGENDVLNIEFAGTGLGELDLIFRIKREFADRELAVLGDFDVCIVEVADAGLSVDDDLILFEEIEVAFNGLGVGVVAGEDERRRRIILETDCGDDRIGEVESEDVAGLASAGDAAVDHDGRFVELVGDPQIAVEVHKVGVDGVVDELELIFVVGLGIFAVDEFLGFIFLEIGCIDCDICNRAFVDEVGVGCSGNGCDVNESVDIHGESGAVFQRELVRKFESCSGKRQGTFDIDDVEVMGAFFDRGVSDNVQIRIGEERVIFDRQDAVFRNGESCVVVDFRTSSGKSQVAVVDGDVAAVKSSCKGSGECFVVRTEGGFGVLRVDRFCIELVLGSCNDNFAIRSGNDGIHIDGCIFEIDCSAVTRNVFRFDGSVDHVEDGAFLQSDRVDGFKVSLVRDIDGDALGAFRCINAGADCQRCRLERAALDVDFASFFEADDGAGFVLVVDGDCTAEFHRGLVVQVEVCGVSHAQRSSLENRRVEVDASFVSGSAIVRVGVDYNRVEFRRGVVQSENAFCRIFEVFHEIRDSRLAAGFVDSLGFNSEHCAFDLRGRCIVGTFSVSGECRTADEQSSGCVNRTVFSDSELGSEAGDLNLAGGRHCAVHRQVDGVVAVVIRGAACTVVHEADPDLAGGIDVGVDSRRRNFGVFDPVVQVGRICADEEEVLVWSAEIGNRDGTDCAFAADFGAVNEGEDCIAAVCGLGDVGVRLQNDVLDGERLESAVGVEVVCSIVGVAEGVECAVAVE